jgi:hypothetical protein
MKMFTGQKKLMVGVTVTAKLLSRKFECKELLHRYKPPSTVGGIFGISFGIKKFVLIHSKISF